MKCCTMLLNRFHPLRLFLRRLRRLPVYGWVLISLGLVALLGPLLTPHDPYQPNVLHRLQAPSADYPFGTDALGRCVLSRLIAGARISLGMSLAILALAFASGGMLGLLAGYWGGWPDEVLMRLTDIFMALPALVLALVLARAAGSGVAGLTGVVAFSLWPGYARMVRSLVIQVKHEHYIEVAVITGFSTGWILWRYVLPAILPPLLVIATLGLGRTLLMTSALGFLGVGLVEPTPDWGAMLHHGATHIRTAPHLALFPGLVVSLTVLCCNLLGEHLEKGAPGARRLERQV